MRLREFSYRSKQLVTALERWEDDGGPAAADYQVARGNGFGPAISVLAIHREATRARLYADALSRPRSRLH